MGMKNAFRCLASLAFCNAYRLLRVFPNNDPVMGFALPLARQGKWWHALLFPMLAMASFDLLTLRFGLWTLCTAAAYGLIALAFHFYSRKRKSVGLKTYAKGSIAGVLAFDFLTGPIMSSLLFRVSFAVAFLGQIPFTAMHLASAVPLTLIIAPALDPALRASLNKELNANLSKYKLAFARLSKA